MGHFYWYTISINVPINRIINAHSNYTLKYLSVLWTITMPIYHVYCIIMNGPIVAKYLLLPRTKTVDGRIPAPVGKYKGIVKG